MGAVGQGTNDSERLVSCEQTFSVLHSEPSSRLLPKRSVRLEVELRVEDWRSTTLANPLYGWQCSAGLLLTAVPSPS